MFSELFLESVQRCLFIRCVFLNTRKTFIPNTFSWSICIDCYVFIWACVCMCVGRSPVRVVWLSYEVMEFQPQSVTALDLCFIAYFYVSIPTPPFFPSLCQTSLWERIRLLTYLSTPTVFPPHRIIFPPRRSPSPYQHTATTLTLP